MSMKRAVYRIPSYPIVYLAIMFLTFAVTGCQTTEQEWTVIDRPCPVHTETVGTSVQGRPIQITVLGNGSDTVFVMATIHGNEPAGTPLSQKLIEHLSQRPYLLRDKKVIVMPVANPDGMARKSRFNANGIDLNRNFQADNRVNTTTHGLTGLSEPESRAIDRVIRKYQPDRIIALHQPLRCIDFDGPGGSLAHQMAALCDLPVKQLGARPGSLGSYVGLTMGRPIITVELGNEASQYNADVLWDKYGPMLLTAVTYRVQAK
ncbi:MAG: DUF2817 domain-containing protein [Sedimentisphaerales bacterium]|nr:DUF2817 domain-containing protein [Sedimentisphaerales bacterium]